MHPEFCRRKHSADEKKEVYQVMRDMSKMPGAPAFISMKSQYTLWECALSMQQVCVTTLH